MPLTARVLAACLGLAGPVFAQETDGAWSAERRDAVQRRVDELVERLGAPEYLARRSAEIELTEIGLPAFERVLAGSKSPDPEVSAACEYLLSRLAIEWSEPDDPPPIRVLMQPYGSRDEEERRAVVQRIERLWSGGLTPAADALCRIARFDLSPRIASRAAAALLRGEELAVPDERTEAIAAALRRLDKKHGASRRPATRWLEQFVRRAGPGSGEALPDWDAAAPGASDAPPAEAIDPAAQAAIEWHRLRLQLMSGSGRPAATVGRLVEIADQRLGPAAVETTLRRVFDWLLEARAEGAVDTVIEQQRAELATKPGGYLVASVRLRQGGTAEAERLAARALATPYAQTVPLRGGGVMDGRLAVARWLSEQRLREWAHNEYRRVAAEAPALSPGRVLAQHDLAMSLLDAARYAEAADTLDRLVEEIEADGGGKRRYAQLLDSLGGYGLQASNVQEARRHYARALAHRAGGDEPAARRSLDQAIESGHADADVLIAMHRSTDANREYRRGVLRRIAELAEAFEKKIEDDPSDHGSLNQWAWLVSNTQGDYTQAIEYSRRSLRLSPDDPGYLDTLGRCYFSAGRLADAVRTQRRAVDKLPHMEVMRRQLAEFEAAFAASQQKGEE